METTSVKSVNCLLFSGGRTSGLMLKRMLDRGGNFVTIFCNTGRERNQTLDFVHECETRWKVPVIWLEYHRVRADSIPIGIFPTPRRNLNLAKAAERGETAHWFKIVDYKTASRNGEPFNELLEWMTVLPNVVSRGCSTQLKIRTAMRYLFSLGYIEYSPMIGIRDDEAHRSIEILKTCDSFEHPRFPLIEDGIRESDVLRFWKENDFDLQLQSYEGNCDLCFLKAKWKRIRLIREHPEMANWWKDWESRKAGNGRSQGNGKYFRLGEPYAEIEKLAQYPEQVQIDLPLAFAGEDIACSCAEKGFESSEDI